MDRSGRAIQQVLPPGQYLGLDLSPDGSRALVTERIDSQNDALSMIFYVAADGAMMAVPVTSESGFEHGPEFTLFQTRSQQVLAPFAPSYAVGADGKKFLIRSELTKGAYRTITVVANVPPNRGVR